MLHLTDHAKIAQQFQLKSYSSNKKTLEGTKQDHDVVHIRNILGHLICNIIDEQKCKDVYPVESNRMFLNMIYLVLLESP